ncbi:MAG: PAS domain S-box protein, partial [Deltaproteobacteria bacterium]
MAIGIAEALRRLHKQGIVHKDVKPANILVEVGTGKAWLTGFGIASRIPRERQAPIPPKFIAGTLAYIAPEQTGRMNRSVDSRSDLYAFGVTLYQLLTGELPFTAADPMEWIHSHVARAPRPPGERVKGIPSPVQDIVLKLLCKTAEERYQTGAGAAADLRRCLAELESSGHVDPFSLASQDVPDRLLIPERLYGRECDVATLFAAFERFVASGTPGLVLVSGYSGVGKSSLVNELHRWLVPSRGLFASGKFQELKRDIPYSSLVEAFQGLVRPLLSECEGELARWRDAIQQAVGLHGQLLVNLIPELALVIGKQPPVADLPPQEAQIRFQELARRFLGVFARPEHPLALFLDDLQWLDKATLELLEHLVTHPDVRHVFFVGAYRDNEVSPCHPLMRMLESVRNAGISVQQIVLRPLVLSDVGQLVAETVHCKAERALPLAKLVREKTGGNPFFTIQFITMLADEGMLAFDAAALAWTWDEDRIRAKGFTDNVADLMAAKLGRLPETTQEALKRLACVGKVAGISTLILVLNQPAETIHAAFSPAVVAGLVLRSEDSYSFLHDRVQEAAYTLIPESHRARVHLEIGRLLAAHTLPEKREEAIFEIVNQLNRGTALITSREEREQVADLNRIAGSRAKSGMAYASALNYLATGEALLGEDCWERQYALAFALAFHRAACEFLTGEQSAAEERLSLLSRRAANLVDLAAVTCLRVALYTTLDRSDLSVEVGLEYLKHVGIEWSPHPKDEEVRQEYDRMWQQIGDRPIEALFELPLMSEPDLRATMDVLTEMTPPAFFTDTNLFGLALLRMANVSIGHGNTDGSCFAYVCLNMVVGARFGDYRAGFRFGQVSIDLVEKRGLDRFKARVYMCFGNMVLPWTKALCTGRGLLRRAIAIAQEAGDVTFGVYSYHNLVANLLVSGASLDDAQREADHGLEWARKARFGFTVDIMTGQLRIIQTLRGLTPDFGSFNDDQFDEGRFERHLESTPQLAFPTCFYWISKLKARFHAADYASALAAAAKARPLLWTTTAFFEEAEYVFYAALAFAGSCDSAPADERPHHLEMLSIHYQRLVIWAENCPENFANRVALVAAEIARLEGRELDAERLYEDAIRLAHAHDFIQNEAMANELAAGFHAARGFDTVAQGYFRNARGCYLRWGALGKVAQLDRRHPRIEEPAPPGPTATIGAPVEHLDLATMVDVSQALSGEILLEKLIETLMVKAVEHAGAGRGLLILLRGDEPRIEAEATTDQDRVTVSVRHATVGPGDLPESMLRYVIRTRESVILDDAASQNLFSPDPYIRQKVSRSVLCLPLVKQAKLNGVLYLENNLASHVFTPARTAVLKVLASQAAISLDNAHLYADLKAAEEKTRQAERQVRRVVDNIPALVWTASADGLRNFFGQRWLDYTGLSQEETLALGWTAAIHPDDLEQLQANFQRAKAEGKPAEAEARMRRADGAYRWFLGRCVPLRDSSGQIEGWYGSATDIEDRKQAEQSLRRSEAY